MQRIDLGFTPALIALTKREAVSLLLAFTLCQRSVTSIWPTDAASHLLFKANVKENHLHELNKLDLTIFLTKLVIPGLTEGYPEDIIKKIMNKKEYKIKVLMCLCA